MTDAISLDNREVHVWFGTSPAGSFIDCSTWDVLSSDERAAADRLRDDGDRALRVRARATLRRLLARYAGTDPEDICFERNRHGKPELVGGCHPRLRFNLSHSGAMILVAVTAKREVGVDVERVQRDLPWEEVACSFLSPVEVTTIRSVPAGCRVRTFFECWVRKEAYLKGLGTGLSSSLDGFVVPLGPDGGAVHDDRGAATAGADWRVHPLDPGRGYAAALAVAGDARVICRRLSV